MKALALLMIFPFAALPALAQVQSRAFKATIDALNNETVPYVSCEELKRWPDAVRLDTRARPEFDVSHLPGARWVGYDDFDPSRVNGIPKTARIVVYCSVSYRSEKVGETLLAAGFKNVYNLYGSLFEWVNQGNPVVGPDVKPTSRVHAYNRMWGVWLRRGEKVYE